MEFTDWSPKKEEEVCDDIYGNTSQTPFVTQHRSQMIQHSQSPDRLQKERRLLIILDKLPAMARNNNHYSQYPQTLQPHHLIQLSIHEPVINDVDTPLDLSMPKHEDSTEDKNSQQETEFTCVICEQTFPSLDRLSKHMSSRHSNRKPEIPKIHECSYCNRRFTRSDMLTRHLRKHTGIKPYVCHVCGQVFSRSDHLTTHHRTHTGEKPYRCPACPYAACRRDMITRHMKIHVPRIYET